MRRVYSLLDKHRHQKMQFRQKVVTPISQRSVHLQCQEVMRGSSEASEQCSPGVKTEPVRWINFLLQSRRANKFACERAVITDVHITSSVK